MSVCEMWWSNFEQQTIEPCSQPLNRGPQPASGLAPCIFSSPGVARFRGAYRLRCRGSIVTFAGLSVTLRLPLQTFPIPGLQQLAALVFKYTAAGPISPRIFC